MMGQSNNNSDPTVVRFWEKVGVLGKDECWSWTGAKHYFGYGVFGMAERGRRSMMLAHRIALEFATGVRPSGMYAMHSCDNPPCVNPGHLRWGTSQENNADMRRKKRMLHGTKHPFTKLDISLIDALIAEYKLTIPMAAKERRFKVQAIAIKYGVSKSYVVQLGRGRQVRLERRAEGAS